MTPGHRIGAWTTVVVLVFALGWGIGRDSGADDELQWQTGEGRVGVEVFSVTVDDRVFGARGAIPMWVDESGSWHSGTWPDCLELGETTVRFAVGPLSYLEGVGQRPVLAVDCRT